MNSYFQVIFTEVDRSALRCLPGDHHLALYIVPIRKLIYALIFLHFYELNEDFAFVIKITDNLNPFVFSDTNVAALYKIILFGIA